MFMVDGCGDAVLHSLTHGCGLSVKCSHRVCAVSPHFLDTLVFIKQVYYSASSYLFPLDKHILYKLHNLCCWTVYFKDQRGSFHFVSSGDSSVCISVCVFV